MDYRDVILEAQALFAANFQAHMEKLLAPIIKQGVMMQWANIPEDEKEKIKAEDPDTYRSLQEFLHE